MAIGGGSWRFVAIDADIAGRGRGSLSPTVRCPAEPGMKHLAHLAVGAQSKKGQTLCV